MITDQYTYTDTHALLLVQTHIATPHGAFLFHTYMSVSSMHMMRYTQFGYLFH